MNRIRILIVDDHQMVRVGLRTLLGRFPHIEVVGEAGTAKDALDETVRLQPDVLLLDVRLPDGSGFDVCRKVQEMPGEVRVLILTSFADSDIVFESISAGADGYLLKEIGAEDLVHAIEKVAAGQSILDPAVTRKVLGRVRNPSEAVAKDKLESLSSQQLKVLALVAEGKTNKEIAVSMGLSDKTVKNYFSNILDKLDLTRRSQAAAFYAQRSGIKY